MVDAVSIALSGLMALGQQVAASANNIANIDTVGALPTLTAPATTVYKPLSVSYTALTIAGQGAGVQAHVTADPNGYTPVYDPHSPYADSTGLIAAPNVDLTREMVNLMESKILYKANASVIKAENKMTNELIDTVT